MKEHFILSDFESKLTSNGWEVKISSYKNSFFKKEKTITIECFLDINFSKNNFNKIDLSIEMFEKYLQILNKEKEVLNYILNTVRKYTKNNFHNIEFIETDENTQIIFTLIFEL